MADYWKSTPKYYCKHCSLYVVDTKLGRANHEATGKHQSAVRRALRDLHRNHEREERDKERAKREVERLNNLVDGGSGSGDKPRPRPQQTARPAPTAATVPPREQLEQLAELGVSIPDALRGDLAMAGDWTVTETRVIAEEGGSGSTTARSFGVRKRVRGDGGDDDDEDTVNGRQDPGHSEFDKIDVDAAVQGLFKRPRQWGRQDTRTMGTTSSGGSGGGSGGGVEDGNLDSLLSRTLVKKDEGSGSSSSKVEEGGVKTEGRADIKAEPALETKIKQEADADASVAPIQGGCNDGAPAAADAGVLFKKRKSKATRHR